MPSARKSNTKKPIFERVLVKISGQLLGVGEHPLDRDRLALVAEQIKAMHDLGVQTAVVIGGGNIVRGAHTAKRQEIERVTADHMGMLGTVINGLALMDTLEKMGQPTRVMSAVDLNRFCEPYILRRATHHLDKGRVIILVAGTGNPYFSTDTAAALRAKEIGADIVIKATKVDGIYSSDPMKNPKAKKFDMISFEACIEKNLQVMDATAFTLCRENNLPILVVDLFAPGVLKKAALGETIGTRVG